MSTGAAASVAAGLSTALSNLSPGQLFSLGHHLTSSDEARALALIGSMSQNPTMASALVGSLSAIPNLPPQVMTWVAAAISNPAQFASNMAQATEALQNAVVQPGLLGSLGL